MAVDSVIIEWTLRKRFSPGSRGKILMISQEVAPIDSWSFIYSYNN